MNRPITIAVPKDAEDLADLINSAFEVEKFFIETARTNTDQVSALMESGKFLLIRDEGRMVACVYVEIRGESGYLGLLSVDPSHAGTGLGSYLVRAAEDRCRREGCRKMELQTVNLRTELPGYYRRLGYEQEGIAPFPPATKTLIPCHFIKMSKLL